MSDPIIQIKNVHKFFGKVHALNDVSLHVESGDDGGDDQEHQRIDHKGKKPKRHDIERQRQQDQHRTQ